jgi:hypothetical protein
MREKIPKRMRLVEHVACIGKTIDECIQTSDGKIRRKGANWKV